MIRFTSDNGIPTIIAELKGFGVYLDNDSLIELAKKRSESLRERFVIALGRGGTLLFSLTNAVEIAGPQGDSASAVRAFLESLGPNWILTEMNPWKVARREEAGFVGQAAIADESIKAYFKQRAHERSPQGNTVLSLAAETFFSLAAVLDWVHQNRDEVRKYGTELDRVFQERFALLRSDFEKNNQSLDVVLPPVPFDQSRPATFVLSHLQRKLIIDAKQFHLKKNDALDFCHAVMAAAYGSIATLDKHWKRRIEELPKPNSLARVFYKPQLAQLVDLLESLIRLN